MLDSERAMTEFLNYIATEPEIARVPIMIDSSKWSVILGGSEVRSGEADCQLDQPEGRRRRVPEQGCDDPALRRRRRRHGVRRTGPGRHDRAQGFDLPARVRAARRNGPGSIRPTSSSIPTSWRSQRGSRSTTTTPSTSSKRRALIKATCPGVKVSGGISNLSFSFRGNDAGARGDALGVSLPRHQGRAGHGDRQRRPARRVRGHPEGAPRAGRRHHFQPAARRHRAAHGVCRDRQGRRGETEQDPAWRSAP